jgi:hypothetical protein
MRAVGSSIVGVLLLAASCSAFVVRGPLPRAFSQVAPLRIFSHVPSAALTRNRRLSATLCCGNTHLLHAALAGAAEAATAA